MESLSICAGSLCCCLIVCSLVRLIAPSGVTSKIISVVISVFTLCCLFTPIADLAKSFDMSAYEHKSTIKSQELEKAYDDNVINETASFISEYISTLLKSADINAEGVKTVVSVNDDRGIYISSIDIYLYEVSPTQRGNIEKLIYSEFKITPKILESKYGE